MVGGEPGKSCADVFPLILVNGIVDKPLVQAVPAETREGVSPEVLHWLNRITNMVDAAGTTAYGYAASGQLWTEDGPWANDTVTNTYNNRLRTGLSLAQPTGSWTNAFNYDGAKRLTNFTSQAGAFDYTLVGQASRLSQKISLPNSSYITNTYDTVARLTGTWLKTSTNGTLDSATYGYNLANQRTTFTNAAGTFLGYTYDKIGQLKVADSSVNSEDRGYLYDAAWNLNKVTNNGVVGMFTVDNKNQLTQDPLQLDAYDSNGNLVSRTGGYSYTYDDENQLTSLSFGTSYRSDFGYDGQGRLRNRTDYIWTGTSWTSAGGAEYLYDGMRVIQERNASNVPTVSYTRGTDLSGSLEGAGGIGGLLGRSHGYASTNGNWYTHNFYHADGNGNITYLVNSSQALAASYRYDPFGNTTASSGTLAAANVYRFSSKEIHVNSGLYYYGYRWYAPGVQRWLNRDPINELGFEQFNYPRAWRASYHGHDYGFLANQPLSLIDPFGLIKWGKTCKQGDKDKIKNGFTQRCKDAKSSDCFKCLDGKGKQAMGDACDSKDGTGPEVQCEDGTNTRCQTTARGTACGWTDPDKTSISV